jgi:hypothetical protein
MRSAAAKAAEGRLMCLLLLVPGRFVIGTKPRDSLERPLVRGVKSIPAFRKRAALEIAMTSKGPDV